MPMNQKTAIQLPDYIGALAGFIEHKPVRRCAITGRRLPKAAMVRLASDGERLVPDFGAVMPGRGLWLIAEVSVLARAACSDGLRLGGRQGKLKVQYDLPDIVWNNVKNEVVRLFALAMKSGAVMPAVADYDGLALGGSGSNSITIQGYSWILEAIGIHNLVPLAIKMDILPALFWPTLVRYSLMQAGVAGRSFDKTQ